MPEPARVVALHLSERSRAPLRAVGRVIAVADRGLEGDRHARAGSRRSVLFMTREVLKAFDLAPGDVREQVTIAGLALESLPDGTRFRVGGARFELGGPCAPCERMNELRAGLRAALDGRRGRFARVLEGGGFAVGDAIEMDAHV